MPASGFAIVIVSDTEPLTVQLTLSCSVVPFGGVIRTAIGMPPAEDACTSEFAEGSTRLVKLVASDFEVVKVAVGVPDVGGGEALAQLTAILVTDADATVPAPLVTVQF